MAAGPQYKEAKGFVNSGEFYSAWFGLKLEHTMRSERCPICLRQSRELLQLHFNRKMNLPTAVSVRDCGSCNFLFIGCGDQASYDEYYGLLANDSYHSEVASADRRSPIAKLQCDQLLKLLGEFFEEPRRVLDFGCGEAWLLRELASQYRDSSFCGFDPSPAADVGSQKAAALNLTNLHFSRKAPTMATFDLVIASHVLEHLIDFDLLCAWNRLLSEDGLLYIEVPNAPQYVQYQRLEFLYYFDRLHVNHFTPKSLTKLLGHHGFGYVAHFEYEFPYRDGKPYPALGMLFRKGGKTIEIAAPELVESAKCYIQEEQRRAKSLRDELSTYEGVLVWGAGDNFFRSSENGGPLSDLANIVVLDRCSQNVSVGSRQWQTEIPRDAIKHYSWPVVITVSEGRKSIRDEVRQVDSSRKILFL